MPQYILKYPIVGKIYSANNPKDAGKKAFLDLCRYNNYNQSRITIIENNSKKEYNFLGMTNDKINQYNEVLKSKNPIQIGGNSSVNDRQFYDKLSEISGNINLSVDELTKILKQKFEPKDDMIILVKDGLNKLDDLNRNVDIIARSLGNQKINVDKKKITESEESLESLPITDDKSEMINENLESEKKKEEKEEKDGKGCVIM